MVKKENPDIDKKVMEEFLGVSHFPRKQNPEKDNRTVSKMTHADEQQILREIASASLGSYSKNEEFEEDTRYIQLTQQSDSDNPEEKIQPDKLIRKTMSSKQRKASLEEYQSTFLNVPKITDRKNVFISNPVREQIVDIVRKLGGEKTSVSGFIENLVLNHLEIYKEEIESWKKL